MEGCVEIRTLREKNIHFRGLILAIRAWQMDTLEQCVNWETAFFNEHSSKGKAVRIQTLYYANYN